MITQNQHPVLFLRIAVLLVTMQYGYQEETYMVHEAVSTTPHNHTFFNV